MEQERSEHEYVMSTLAIMMRRIKWQMGVLRQYGPGTTLADVFPIYRAIDQTVDRIRNDTELAWTRSLPEMSEGKAAAGLVEMFNLDRNENTELNLINWLSEITCDDNPTNTEVFVALALMHEDGYPVSDELRDQCEANLSVD